MRTGEGDRGTCGGRWDGRCGGEGGDRTEVDDRGGGKKGSMPFKNNLERALTPPPHPAPSLHIPLQHFIQFVGQCKVLLKRFIVVLEGDIVGHSDNLWIHQGVTDERKHHLGSEVDYSELVAPSSCYKVALTGIGILDGMRKHTMQSYRTHTQTTQISGSMKFV